MRLAEGVDQPVNPLPKKGVFVKENMEKSSTTILINISMKPYVVENVHIGEKCSLEEIFIYTSLFKEFCDVFVWSYEEMSGIDPYITEYEIHTYPNVNPIR